MFIFHSVFSTCNVISITFVLFATPLTRFNSLVYLKIIEKYDLPLSRFGVYAAHTMKVQRKRFEMHSPKSNFHRYKKTLFIFQINMLYMHYIGYLFWTFSRNEQWKTNLKSYNNQICKDMISLMYKPSNEQLISMFSLISYFMVEWRIKNAP